MVDFESIDIEIGLVVTLVNEESRLVVGQWIGDVPDYWLVLLMTMRENSKEVEDGVLVVLTTEGVEEARRDFLSIYGEFDTYLAFEEFCEWLLSLLETFDIELYVSGVIDLCQELELTEAVWRNEGDIQTCLVLYAQRKWQLFKPFFEEEVNSNHSNYVDLRDVMGEIRPEYQPKMYRREVIRRDIHLTHEALSHKQEGLKDVYFSLLIPCFLVVVGFVFLPVFWTTDFWGTLRNGGLGLIKLLMVTLVFLVWESVASYVVSQQWQKIKNQRQAINRLRSVSENLVGQLTRSK